MFICNTKLPVVTMIYHIDTEEMPGLFVLLKNHTFIALREDIMFLSFTCEDIDVFMVTEMISR